MPHSFSAEHLSNRFIHMQMWKSEIANLQLMFFRWGFHRRAGSLCCCYMAPSCWLEVTSPSVPSSWGIIAIKTFKNHAELPGIFDICLFVSSLVPCHSTCLSVPLPQAPNGWITGNMRLSGVTGSREVWQSHAGARASPTSTLHSGFPAEENQLPPPRHCPHLCCSSSASETSCVQTRGVSRRGKEEIRSCKGRSQVEAQEPFCHS